MAIGAKAKAASTPRTSRPRKAAGSKVSRCAAATGETWKGKIRDHHRRQASVAAILDQTLGHFAKSDPGLWERRAYLMLMGLVYERLATNEEEISTDDLVTLAKVLAENRRAEARAQGNHRLSETPESLRSSTGKLPDHLADVVRQVYGTNLQRPN